MFEAAVMQQLQHQKRMSTVIKTAKMTTMLKRIKKNNTHK